MPTTSPISDDPREEAKRLASLEPDEARQELSRRIDAAFSDELSFDEFKDALSLNSKIVTELREIGADKRIFGD